MQKVFQISLAGILVCLLIVGCGNQALNVTGPIANIQGEQPIKERETPTPVLPPNPTVEIKTSEPTQSASDMNSEDTESRTVIAFTGVIVPARCVQEEVSRRGSADYIYEQVNEILSEADITVGVYNATMRDDVPYMGCEKSWELIGSTNNADALATAGFDVISVATNHIKDCGHLFCGNEGFYSTLDNLRRVKIFPVGAGSNLEEALAPVVVEVNGVKFGFVSLGEVNERVFADPVTPGIAFLSNRNLETAIAKVSTLADVVIVLPHSGPEDYPEVTPQQKYWGRYSVQYGADLVVMTHAHILQGYQVVDKTPVFYSLGNFVFDQSWARDHQQAAILLVEFEGPDLVGFELVPTVVDQDGTVHFAAEDEASEILDRIDALSRELTESD